MSFSKIIAYSVIGGVLITLATSIIPNTALIGASNSGYPFAWLSQPLYPIGSLPTIILEGLIVDLVIWSVIAFVLVMVYTHVKSK
jgi:hypothetical protein